MIGTGRKRTCVLLTAFMLFCIAFLASCKSSGGIDILGPSDETAEAGNIVFEANKDLKEIRKLYDKHQDKRDELKQALLADNEGEVKKISGEVVDIINDGASLGTTALEKIDKARELKINPDYDEYLRLKSEALRLQLSAFEEYRQAARLLRDNYDPKNTQARDKVKADFEKRSDRFQEIMEKARESSNDANDLAKEAMKKPKE